MNARIARSLASMLVLAVVAAGCASEQPSATTDAPAGWGDSETWLQPAESLPDPAEFVSGVDNPYWPLLPGTRWMYEAETGDGIERIDVIVLDEIRTVAGIECVVVRDTVKLDGELIEDTFDWYAQDRAGNVWYMGEDSKEYENGEIVSTSGSWEAGVDGALPGIKIWAQPRVGGAPYYQEFYAGEAEDLGRDVAVDGTVAVPFGEYDNVLVIEEWNKLDPETIERKYYAPDVGVVMEEVTRGGGEVVELTEFDRP